MRYRHLRFPEGRVKAVTFSYDDGVAQDIRLSEIFSNAGLKATFNINSYALKEKQENKLNAEEIKKFIIEKGHEVALHGECHIAPAAARPIDAIKDVLNCRLDLEDIFDMTVRGMAYPDSGIRYEANGNTAQRVKEQLSDLGIAYARTLGGDNNEFKLPVDWYDWMPTAHHDNPKIFDYIDKFLSVNYEGKYPSGCRPILFYIWGHSYEFDKKNNWGQIEKITEMLSGKPDIWYATNIEIYDYINAYHSLIISADGTRVYNPTLIKVWFSIDSKIYSVESGEHIRI